jgi:hypothetical protein
MSVWLGQAEPENRGAAYVAAVSGGPEDITWVSLRFAKGARARKSFVSIASRVIRVAA